MSYQQPYSIQQGGQPLRQSPSPPDHSYPPGSPPNFSDENILGQHPPRGFRSSSSGQSSLLSSGDEDQQRGNTNNPYSYGSTPSLPRYASSGAMSNNGNGGNGGAGNGYYPSPLNPTAARGSYSNNGSGGRSQQQQFASSCGYNQAGGNGGNAHPLSNAMYLESSPTLAGSDVVTPGVEDKLFKGADSNPNNSDYMSSLSRTPGGGQNQQSAPSGSYARRGPKPTGLSAVYRMWSGAGLADSGKDERHIKLPRLGYLDGCKFIAAWVVLNGTLFDATISTSDYSFIQRNSPLYITRSTGLGLTFLLLLSGRSLITPLWDVPLPTAPTNPSNPSSKPTNTALISWARLTKAMLVRPFRFILPVIAVVALQWGLGASGKTANCNAVGMDEPYWGLVKNFAGFSTLVFDLFTYYESDTLAGQTFTANLWTSPWFFQASYGVYVTHLMLGNLSSNRYWVYGLLAFFSWTTYNYIFVALMGLVLADMHAHGHLHRIRTKWPLYQRLTLHAILIAIACVTQFVPIVRTHLNDWFHVINVQNHPELTICDSIFAVCWLFCIETSGLAQNVLGNVVMRSLGKIAPGLYLLSPAITFTIVPNLALTMHNNGTKASSVLGLSWLVLFLVTIACSIAFHFVVELPSKLLGEIVVEILEGAEGAFRMTRRSGDGGNKLVKRNVGGGAGGAPVSKLQQSGGRKPVLV